MPVHWRGAGRLITLLFASFLLTAAADPAEPADDSGDIDASATFSLEAILTADRQAIRSIRYGWTFDKQFSQEMLNAFDENEDGALAADELRNASQSVHDTISDYHAFLLADVNGAAVPLRPVAQMGAAYIDGQLRVTFEAMLAPPVALSGRIELGVYDPTLSIDFGEDGALAVDVAPPHCTVAIHRPDIDATLLQHPDALSLDDGDPGGMSIIRLLANRLVLDCKPG